MKKNILLSSLCTLILFSGLSAGCSTIISKTTSTSITDNNSVTTTSLTTSAFSSTSILTTTIPLPTATAVLGTTTTQTTASTNGTIAITSPTTTASTIPAQYQSLYNQLQGYITADLNQINSAWNGSSYPVNYSAELLTADANAGPGILQPADQEMMAEELNAEASMGVKAITVQIGFPIFDPNFYELSGQNAAQAQQTVQNWISYYQGVAQAIHSRGLKMIVESNPLLSYYISSDSSFNPGDYFKSLDFVTYEQLRSQHNIIVAEQIKPDYLLLQTEPDTDSVNDFRTELNNPSQDVAMISKFVNDLQNAGIAGLHTSIQLGSGAGAWQPSWQSYISGLCAIPGLDKIDTHIYNLQPNVNQIGEIAVAEKIADIAHSAGKGASISEFWAHKSDVLPQLTGGGSDPLADIRARDMFSFWAPLDEQFLNLMGDLANYKHFDYISGFGFYNWFALTDYNSVQNPPVYPAANSTQNEVSDEQVTAMQNKSAKQALANGQLSIIGKAYQTVIANEP